MEDYKPDFEFQHRPEPVPSCFAGCFWFIINCDELAPGLDKLRLNPGQLFGDSRFKS